MIANQFTLKELTAVIEGTINNQFQGQTFWVIADVTNHTFKNGSNYHSCDLVEKSLDSGQIVAKICAKAWGKGSTNIRNFERVTFQKFTNNINVLVNVSVSYHSIFGLQLNILDIDTNFTLGVIEQQRRAVLQMLIDENPSFIAKVGNVYQTRNKQLSFKKVIQKIALLSSDTAAGTEDFKHSLLTNDLNYKFDIDDYFTAVQGEGKAKLFFQRLISVFHSGKEYDAVVIVRGGGAQTDFLIFDDYNIGRAVAKFPIPIITGIGHQRNETIADMMAHTQTKTPTEAAKFILNYNRAFEEQLLVFQKIIVIKSQQIFSLNLQSLSRINNILTNRTRILLSRNSSSLDMYQHITINKSREMLYSYRDELYRLAMVFSTKPRIELYNKSKDLQRLFESIKASQSYFLRMRKGFVQHYVTRFKDFSIESTLKRGFAIIKVADRIVASSDEILIGEEIKVVLKKVEITSKVKSKTQYDGREFNL